MKACFAIMGSFLQLSLLAQVPEKGLVSDPDGNVFIAIHAPTSLTYDGFLLPLSSQTSTYVLKTDSNGDLIALSKAEGSATIAGPLSFQNDTLFFAQAAFNSRGENVGEIVLSRLNSDLDYRSTVTFPLPVNARPLAVCYFNNHWGFVFASKSGDKLNYTLAGISHVYTNKWMKSITPYHVSGILGENNDMTVTGTFFNVLRYDGHQINSGGADVFLLKANLYDGAYEMLRATSATSILNTYLQPKGIDYWVAGSMLTTNQDGSNSSAIYAGIVKNTLDSEKLITTVSGDFSETRAICTSATGGAYVLGNFAGLLDLGHNHLVNASSADKNDVFVMKLDAEAGVSWIKNFGSANEDEAVGLAPMPDGGVVIAYAEGSQGYVSGLEKFLEPAPIAGKVKLVRLGANGEIVWERLLETKNK